MRLSPSKVDLHLACNASLRHCPEPYDPGLAASELGRAVHEVLAAWVDSGFERSVVAEAAYRYDVDRRELDYLVDAGINCYHELGLPRGDARAEVRIKNAAFSCFIDVIISRAGSGGLDSLVIIDWKTGREMSPKPGQMLSYALAAAQEFGFPRDGIRTAEVWIRFGEAVIRDVRRERLQVFARGLHQLTTRKTLTYSPGKHCDFCPHFSSCQPRANWLRACVRAFESGDLLEQTPRRQLADLLERRKAVKSALDRYDKALDAALQSGPISRSDGSVLELVEREVESIEPAAGMAALRSAFFSEQDIAGCVTLAKGKVESMVKAREARGEKAETWAAFLDGLRNGGAVRKKTRKEKRLTDGKLLGSPSDVV